MRKSGVALGWVRGCSVVGANRPANCYLGLLRQHYHTEAGTVFDDDDDDDDDDDGVVRHGEHKLTGEGLSDAGANDAAFTWRGFTERCSRCRNRALRQSTPTGLHPGSRQRRLRASR